MAETHNITQISVNGTVYSVGGGDESPFTLTENNGAQMSACTSTGQYAVAEGSGTTASGTCSHAEGGSTTASGNWSHAEGGGTTASGMCSHAEGASTTASGNYSHAEGSVTRAYGDYSHAEGSGATASGNTSHAEGGNTRASGMASHAEGGITTASGSYSHAEGHSTTASGYISHAEGLYTSATTECEHASGRYNVSLSGSSSFGNSGNTLFTVGNGYATGTTVTTHNALQIMQNGDIYIADTSGAGEYYEKPMLMLQEIIKDLQNRVATLEANEVTKAEVVKGFNNVITVVDNNKLKIRNNALEDE